jgi:hypothetical protein
MLYTGLIVLLLGGVSFFVGKRKHEKKKLLVQTKTVPVGQIQDGQQTIVQGIIESNNPLKTPFTRRDCVYYEYELDREVVTKDKEGRKQRKWEKVSSDKQAAPFLIKDDTGKVAVFPDGASIDAQPLGEKYVRPGDELNNPVLKGVVNILAGQQNKVKEKALLVGSPVYVNGYSRQEENGMTIQNGQGDFVVSYKSKEQLEKDMGRTAALLKVLGLVGILAGIGITVYSFI